MADVQQPLTSLADLKTSLDGKSVSEPEKIPLELLSASGKLAKIIDNEDEVLSLKMRDEDYEIKLSKPIYITKVSVHLGEYDDVRGMRLTGSDVLSGKPIKTTIEVTKVTGRSVTFIVKNTLTSFSLHRGGFFSKKLKKIQVYGIQAEDIEKFEREYNDLAETKTRIIQIAQEKIDQIQAGEAKLTKSREETEARLKELEKHIADAIEEKDSLSDEVTELTRSANGLEEQLKKMRTEHVILQAEENEFEKRKLGIESELAQKKQTLSNTNISISNAEDKLNSLVNNVNVFSEEFSGFVNQGSGQVKTYVALALIPLCLLCVVVYNLFQGAVDLSLKFEKVPNIDLLTLLVTRLPFVTVAGLIVGVSVKIVFFLVNRIISIHQQRLDLAKIAIIAKDVSDASAAGLQMSPKEIYEAKTYLKMNILKSYLSGQIDTFSYPQKKIENDETITSTNSTPLLPEPETAKG